MTKTTLNVNINHVISCDLLKIHYLCGDKDNDTLNTLKEWIVVICSKFITFAVTKTTHTNLYSAAESCDLLKIHYLCGDKDNIHEKFIQSVLVVICSKFITFAVTKTTGQTCLFLPIRCDLLKIHYLCGDKDNRSCVLHQASEL